MPEIKGKIKTGSIMLGVAVAFSTTGFFAGGVTAHNQLDASYAAKPEHLKIKTIETERVTREAVPTQPESCARAVELAKHVFEAFGDYDAADGDLRKISQNLASAIFDKSISELNKATVRLNQFDSDTAGIADTLVQSLRMLNAANLTCITEVNKL